MHMLILAYKIWLLPATLSPTKTKRNQAFPLREKMGPPHVCTLSSPFTSCNGEPNRNLLVLE